MPYYNALQMNPDSEETKIFSPPPPRKKWYQYGFIRDVGSFILIVVFVVIPFRIYVAQPYLVTGGSMDPTFENGEYLIVDQLSYRFDDPKRGEVIIFRFPKDPREFFIKRVVGLPGETVKLSIGGVTIVNKDNPEGFLLSEPYVVFDKKDALIMNLKDNEYFVMGDNRIASADSRLWGPVPRENVVGRPFVALFPLSKIRFMPGSVSAFEQTLQK